MPFEPTDYLPYDFANRRHIGPSPEEMGEMLEVLGAGRLDRRDRAEIHPAGRDSELWQAFVGAGVDAQDADDGGQEQGYDLAHRAGLLWHGDAPGDPAQYP